MSDLKSMLERVGERVAPREDALERLGRLRRRKQRARRVRAGALALVVAAGGSTAAVAAFHHPGGHPVIVGSEGTAEFHALWPEQTQADAEHAQDLVDAGQEPWRLDAAQVVSRFAAEVMGWDGSVPESGGCFDSSCPFDRNDQAFNVHRGCLTCPGVVVEVQRLVRPGDTGIWSVTRVAGGDLGFSFPVEPGGTVASGETFVVPFGAPGTELVLAGYSYIGECSGLSSFASPHGGGFFGGQVEFQFAGSSFTEHCESPGSGRGSSASGGSSAGTGPGLLAQPIDGLIWVAIVPKGTAEFDPFARGPGDTAGLDELAAVAVHFVPAASPEASSPTPESPTPESLSPEPSTDPYPRGAFQWCPDVAGSVAPDANASSEASDIALKFAVAYAAGEEQVARSMADAGAYDHAFWSVAGKPGAISVRSDASAAGDGLVTFGCGSDVAAQTWEVSLDDGTDSASLDFTLYLIQRADGWKVWGSY